jgi:hypothetical protein
LRAVSLRPFHRTKRREPVTHSPDRWSPPVLSGVDHASAASSLAG